jgi:hypothetical protein
LKSNINQKTTTNFQIKDNGNGLSIRLNQAGIFQLLLLR